MRGSEKSNGYCFNLYNDGINKPVIPGNIREAATDHDLLAELG